MAKAETKRTTPLTWGAAAVVLLILVYGCLGPGIPVIDIPVVVTLFLTIGWAAFIWRVVPQLTLRLDLFFSTVVYATVLVIGVHLFLRWLFREIARSTNEIETPRTWRWRWTLSGFVLIILMFAAGISAIGIVHQTTWLIRSPFRIFMEGGVGERANRVKCASNLRQIGQGIALYANDHHGNYPDDFRPLFLECDVNTEVFTCPSSNDDRAVGNTKEEIANNILTKGHCSYIYFGKGLKEPVDPDKIIAIEHLPNHEVEGMNVLYADGHVDWLDQPEADQLMQKLGFKRDQGKPDWQPTTRP